MSVAQPAEQGQDHPGSHWTGHLRTASHQGRWDWNINEEKNKQKHQVLIVRLNPDISYQIKLWIFHIYKSCCISFLIVRRAWVHVSLLSLGAVAVHASICGLPAGLPSHPASHLHRQACLCAPLDSAAQLFTSRFWTSFTHDTNDREGERRIVSPQHWTGGTRVARREAFTWIITGIQTLSSARTKIFPQEKTKRTSVNSNSIPEHCRLFKKIDIRNTMCSLPPVCATDCLWGTSGSKFTYKHPLSMHPHPSNLNPPSWLIQEERWFSPHTHIHTLFISHLKRGWQKVVFYFQ